MDENDDEADDVETDHVDDALTIDELIECLERLRGQAPEKGATRVRMPDGLPVVMAELGPTHTEADAETCVYIIDMYDED